MYTDRTDSFDLVPYYTLFY